MYHTLFQCGWFTFHGNRFWKHRVRRLQRWIRDYNQVYFLGKCFYDFVIGKINSKRWRFLRIPHRSCLQKSEATLHEKYDDRPERHSNITWYWFERAPSTGWAWKSWSKNRWTTTTIIFNLFDKVIGQQQTSEEIEPGVKSKYGLLFVCFLQQPSQLLHLWTVSINKISTGFLPLKSIKFSYLKNPSNIPI